MKRAKTGLRLAIALTLLVTVNLPISSPAAGKSLDKVPVHCSPAPQSPPRNLAKSRREAFL